ncbi:TetR/AcrR family transcriptional regulator [Humidisolicoccus flavus]|uniref:TetR/AcrR family transcriptional regulator n=1 Tax=Humidisolicoccus flavus TaxID=3111414 RepID=UPI0032452737
MAWDVEGTKQRLLEAGRREFCDHGLAGARVDRIAKTAGANKERLYQYFGNKEQFFDFVVTDLLGGLFDEVPLQGQGPSALGEFAGKRFDRHVQDATLARLLFWEGLERRERADIDPDRAVRHSEKVATVQEMLPGISANAAADLLLTVVSLTDAWVALPQLESLLAGDDPKRTAERRAAIVSTVTLAAQAAIDAVDAEAADPNPGDAEAITAANN